MKSYENPYTLTFGIKPNQYISRVQQTEEIIGTLQSENTSVRVYLINGVRCSSKTVLITNVSDELKKKKEWIVIHLNPTMKKVPRYPGNLLPGGIGITFDRYID